jgi:hypothetical protein
MPQKRLVLSLQALVGLSVAADDVTADDVRGLAVRLVVLVWVPRRRQQLRLLLRAGGWRVEGTIGCRRRGPLEPN